MTLDWKMGITIPHNSEGIGEEERTRANRLIIGSLIAAALIYAVFLYSSKMQHFHQATLVFLSCLGLIFGLRQVWIMRRLSKATFEWNQKKATIEYLNAYIDKFSDFILANGYFDPEKKTWLIHKFDLTKISNKEYSIQYRRFLNYWESFAAGIKHGVYDESVAYDLSRGLICHAYSLVEPCMGQVRGSNIRVYELLEDLAKKWNHMFESREHHAKVIHSVRSGKVAP